MRRCSLETPEVGIYKRKQESKKTRTRPIKRPRKKEKTFFFLDDFLGRVLHNETVNGHKHALTIKYGSLLNGSVLCV